MKHKKIFIASITIIVLLITLTTVISLNTKNQVKELFRLNKKIQEENYYAADFEFKMLGILYLLDKGHYYSAIRKINVLHHKMKTREGLIKMPDFKTKEEELEFYLNLQNPKTGAFIDDSYPLNTYHEPTQNVLQHISKLIKETNQEFKLKYPLYYLDNINTTEKLIPILEDWSTVGWIASKFPQTPFHNVRDLIILARDKEHHNMDEFDMVIQENGLYNFTPEWKHSLLQWIYDFQDSETGLWGPKFKNGKLAKIDLSNTASIIKTFVDKDGNDIYAEFPLKYRDKLFNSALKELEKDYPESEIDLDEWHEWSLKTSKGLRTLTRYLWKNASDKNKQHAKKLIEKYIYIKFDKFYIPEEGAFSYYPSGEHATLDGTSGGFLALKEFGALSSKKQIKLWGKPDKTIQDLGIIRTSNISEKDFDWATNKEINSIRVYQSVPEFKSLIKNISVIIYPNETKVLDIVDLVSKIKKWLNTTDQTMGNWVSGEELKKELNEIQVEKPNIYNKIPIKILNQLLKHNKQLTIIGFDTLQIPRAKITFKLKK